MRSRTLVFVGFAATMLFSIIREWSAPTGCLRAERRGQLVRHDCSDGFVVFRTVSQITVSGSGMPVEHVSGNIGPELAEDVGERVPAKCVGVLLRESTGGSGAAGVIGQRYPLSHASTKNLRGIKGFVSVIIGRDDDAGRRVDTTLPDPALALGVVTLVLMKNTWQSKNHQIIAIGLVEVASPVVVPKAARAFSKLSVRIGCFRQERSNAHEN